MIGALLVLLLQVSAPEAAPATETPIAAAPVQMAAAAPAAARPGRMNCTYDRVANVRNCTNADGQALICRRHQRVGTRFYDWVCLTPAEDEAIQRESQEALDRQQRITTPDRQ